MFYGLQLKDGEEAHHGVWAFFQAALKRGTKFKRLDVFSYVTVGPTLFVRFRTGCPVSPELINDFLAEGRGFILPSPATEYYTVKLPDGRSGTFGLATMHAIAAPGLHRIYRGPKVDFWERQFHDLTGS